MARQVPVSGPLDSGTRALLLGAAAVVTVSVLILMLNSLGTPDFGRPGLPLRQGAVPLEVSSPTPGVTPSASTSRAVEVSVSSPSVTARPSTSSRRPATSTPARPGSFAADHELRLAWNNGHISRLTVRNTGSGAADWTAAITVDNGVKVDRYWIQGGGAAELDQRGTGIRATGRLAAGASIIVEYQLSRPAGASTEPRSCTVNGSPCR